MMSKVQFKSGATEVEVRREQADEEHEHLILSATTKDTREGRGAKVVSVFLTARADADVAVSVNSQWWAAPRLPFDGISDELQEFVRGELQEAIGELYDDPVGAGDYDSSQPDADQRHRENLRSYHASLCRMARELKMDVPRLVEETATENEIERLRDEYGIDVFADNNESKGDATCSATAKS